MSERLMTEAARKRLYNMQEEIARVGWYSVVWREGEMWHIIASTNPHQLDREMHSHASEESGPGHWVPAVTEQPADGGVRR